MLLSSMLELGYFTLSHTSISDILSCVRCLSALRAFSVFSSNVHACMAQESEVLPPLLATISLQVFPVSWMLSLVGEHASQPCPHLPLYAYTVHQLACPQLLNSATVKVQPLPSIKHPSLCNTCRFTKAVAQPTSPPGASSGWLCWGCTPGMA